jgi:hypothetical protein
LADPEPHFIVGGACFGIAQDLVGPIEVPESLFGLLVTGIKIGMMQLGQRAERSLDFGGVRTASDPEALIEITHTCRLCLKWTLTSVVHVLFWDRVGTSATSKRFACGCGP